MSTCRKGSISGSLLGLNVKTRNMLLTYFPASSATPEGSLIELNGDSSLESVSRIGAWLSDSARRSPNGASNHFSVV